MESKKKVSVRIYQNKKKSMKYIFKGPEYYICFKKPLILATRITKIY